MNAHTDLIDRYFDAWNETDAVRRRELIAATWASDADYRDPLLAGAGHDGIDAMIRAVHERFPHHTFHRTTEVDGFANRLRRGAILGAHQLLQCRFRLFVQPHLHRSTHINIVVQARVLYYSKLFGAVR